ncbi:MAG: TonB-dependent receptor [Acidobacteria bacterium]|nr:TonB-dependent receptor [Acidobacteriota bacterium]
MTRFLVALAWGLLVSSAAQAEVSGRVVDAERTAVPGAEVSDLESGSQATTAEDGTFILEASKAPVRLRISKPGFRDLVVEIPTGTQEPARIEIHRLEFSGSEVTVSAGLVARTQAPRTLAASTLFVEDAAPGASTVSELASEVAAVSENGQGGLFQVVSVRGISGSRVRLLVDGIRIVGERRAGASASFVDPSLLGALEVVRGPSSSFYGSGALGGVLHLVPRSFEAATATLGYGTEGNQGLASFGWGSSETGWSLGLAHRRAGKSQTPGGQALNTGFRQTSATASKLWSQPNAKLRLLSSWGRDIGKSNADFPQEVTLYPEERHLILGFTTTARLGWRFDANLHPNDLETLGIAADGSTALVKNRALDFGLALGREWQHRDELHGRYGLEAFGRRGVRADELRVSAEGEEASFRTLDDGSLDELGIFSSLLFTGRRLSLEAGGRATWTRQKSGTGAAREDSAGSAFVGASLPLGDRTEVVVNVGTGLRFPSLSERFFSGTTGRGRVVGSPDLDPERSLTSDLGFRWFGPKHHLAIYGFRNAIDDYIERVEIEPGLRSFRNLTRGTLEGLELDALFRVAGAWRLTLQGHRIRGRSDTGDPLADIPPDRLAIGVHGRSGAWGLSGRWQFRWAKRDPAGGERAIGGGHLVSASVQRSLPRGIELQATLINLLDEEIFLSADDLATQAAGRAWALQLTWRG